MDESGAKSDSAAQWSTVAAHARTLAGNPASTIKPRDAGMDSRGRAALGAFVSDVPGPDTPRLQLGATLGEGGMGIVRVAVQVAMGRDVAVKAVRPALRAAGPTLKLLQEAWTTGRLEHPNIIPVYDIATGEDGEPLILLKRIEGETWSAVLADRDRARERYNIADWLEWNLDVLMQVCNAIDFAHDRGVLHLDLKPENVMIGRHGEVYVVDWGIALALLDDCGGRLPLTTNHRGIIGTPHYMAPEMLEGDGTRLSERTDIYLLGATLFELLADRPPHYGDTILEALHAAHTNAPEFPDDAPAELVAICRTALARTPARRYQSARELRTALQGFLRHRESGRMAREAEATLTQLAEHADARVESVRAELFGRARFGFEQALASWPDNPDAREGLTRAFALMVELEVTHGDPQVAGSLAAQAPSLPAALRTRVQAAVQRRRAGLDELEGHRQDEDLRIGERTRFSLFGMMGVVWIAMAMGAHWIEPPRGVDVYPRYLLGSGVTLAVVLGLGFWARESMSRTRVNRTVLGAVVVALVGQIALFLGAAALGIPSWQASCFMPLVWALAVTLSAAVADRRGAWLIVNYLLAFAIVIAAPEQRWITIAIANALTVLLSMLWWWPRRLRGPQELTDHRA